jgi:multiple sugar transport system substrate-binding protein
MQFKWKGLVLVAVSLAMVLTGCGSSGTVGENKEGDAGKQEANVKVEVSTEPVTLTFYVQGVTLTDAEFQTYIVEPLQKKHPNITLQKLSGKLENLVGGNQTPDIILADNHTVSPALQLGIPLDLTDLTKKFQVDLSQFASQTIVDIKNMDETNKLYAFPFSINAGYLWYNKDIFDKFGVPYPTDNMLWDDVIARSRKITREEGGVNYVGWDPVVPDKVEYPFSQPYIDPKTNKALIDTPVYKKVLELMKQQYDMPGFIGPKSKYKYNANDFIKNQNVAMLVEWQIKMMGQLIEAHDNNTFKNWDLATNPNFPENAGKGWHTLTGMLIISQTTKYKDQAMQVLITAASKEAQTIQSRNARITVSSDPGIINQFGQDVPALKGKNVDAIFKFKWSPIPRFNVNDPIVEKIVRSLSKTIAIDKVDVNTALREAQAEADSKLAEAAAQ